MVEGSAKCVLEMHSEFAPKIPGLFTHNTARYRCTDAAQQNAAVGLFSRVAFDLDLTMLCAPRPCAVRDPEMRTSSTRTQSRVCLRAVTWRAAPSFSRL